MPLAAKLCNGTTEPPTLHQNNDVDWTADISLILTTSLLDIKKDGRFCSPNTDMASPMLLRLLFNPPPSKNRLPRLDQDCAFTSPTTARHTHRTMATEPLPTMPWAAMVPTPTRQFIDLIRAMALPR